MKQETGCSGKQDWIIRHVHWKFQRNGIVFLLSRLRCVFTMISNTDAPQTQRYEGIRRRATPSEIRRQPEYKYIASWGVPSDSQCPIGQIHTYTSHTDNVEPSTTTRNKRPKSSASCVSRKKYSTMSLTSQLDSLKNSRPQSAKTGSKRAIAATQLFQTPQRNESVSVIPNSSFDTPSACDSSDSKQLSNCHVINSPKSQTPKISSKQNKIKTKITSRPRSSPKPTRFHTSDIQVRPNSSRITSHVYNAYPYNNIRQKLKSISHSTSKPKPRSDVSTCDHVLAAVTNANAISKEHLIQSEDGSRSSSSLQKKKSIHTKESHIVHKQIPTHPIRLPNNTNDAILVSVYQNIIELFQLSVDLKEQSSEPPLAYVDSNDFNIGNQANTSQKKVLRFADLVRSDYENQDAHPNVAENVNTTITSSTIGASDIVSSNGLINTTIVEAENDAHKRLNNIFYTYNGVRQVDENTKHQQTESDCIGVIPPSSSEVCDGNECNTTSDHKRTDHSEGDSVSDEHSCCGDLANINYTSRDLATESPCYPNVSDSSETNENMKSDTSSLNQLVNKGNKESFKIEIGESLGTKESTLPVCKSRFLKTVLSESSVQRGDSFALAKTTRDRKVSRNKKTTNKRSESLLLSEHNVHNIQRGKHSMDNEHSAAVNYDANLEKSNTYLRSKNRTFTQASQYMKSVGRGLSKLSVQYSQTNTAYNDRVIMTDLLKNGHMRSSIIADGVYAMERRLYNRRSDPSKTTTFYDRFERVKSAQPVSSTSRKKSRTVADRARERQERISKKNEVIEHGFPPRALSLPEVTAEDIEHLLDSCRYLRVDARKQPNIYGDVDF